MRRLPNFLTFFRLASVPFLVAFFYVPSSGGRWCLLVGFSLACATDFLDGYAARQFQSVSRLGRIWDPIADKVLVCVMLLMLVGESDRLIQGVHLIPCVVIVFREFFVTGLRESLAPIHSGLSVTALSQVKTVAQMVAVGLLFVVRLSPCSPEMSMLHSTGLVGLWIASCLTGVTGFVFLRKTYRHF